MVLTHSPLGHRQDIPTLLTLSVEEWIAQTGEINWRNCLGASIRGSSCALVAQVPQGSPLWAPINLSGGAARSEAPAEIYVPQKCHRFWEHDLGMGSRAHTSCRLSFSFHSK